MANDTMEKFVPTFTTVVDSCSYAPITTTMTTETSENNVPTTSSGVSFKPKIVWPNIVLFTILHSFAIYGLFWFVRYGTWLTLLWAILISNISGQGVTLGAHRLYSHRTYKAHFSIRLLVNILHVKAGQNSMHTWVSDHRQHHMYTDTNADPHNSKRGFFFSHMGWLLMKKHPDVIAQGKNVDLSDIEADPIVMFQKKYYIPLYLVFAIWMPVAVPIYCWYETYIGSFCLAYAFRYILALHITWLVNSAAHMYGTKPYNRNISSVESLLVSFLTSGEGWHNYHHTFPWDYRTSELGIKVNVTRFIIDTLAYFGLVYDLGTAPKQMVQQRILSTGDGTKTI